MAVKAEGLGQDATKFVGTQGPRGWARTPSKLMAGRARGLGQDAIKFDRGGAQGLGQDAIKFDGGEGSGVGPRYNDFYDFPL